MKPPCPYVSFELLLVSAVVIPNGLRSTRLKVIAPSSSMVSSVVDFSFYYVASPTRLSPIPTGWVGKEPPRSFRVDIIKNYCC